jgi:hypothetical protein
MKKISLALLALLSLNSLNAQVGANAFYVNSVINMKPSSSSGNGGGLDVFFGPQDKNFSAGFSFFRSVYGKKTEPIHFNTYGYEVNTNLNLKNDFTNVSLYSRYKLGKLNNFLTPFAEGKLGWAFLSTRLNIEQSMDMGGCQPVQPNTVHEDNAWVGYAGGGIDIKLRGLCRKDQAERELSAYITIAAGYSFGGKLEYFNPEHADQTTHQHSDTQNYNAEFINYQTGELHEHTIGTLQTSRISMAEFKIGLGFRF